MATVEVIWLFLVKTQPLRGYSPAPTFPPYRSASGIGNANKKLSKMAGNPASFQCTVDTMNYFEQLQISGKTSAGISNHSQDTLN